MNEVKANEPLRQVGIAAGMIRRADPQVIGLAHLAESITFGSFTLMPREGNPEPVYWYDGQTGLSINAVGLRNLGLPHFLENEFIEATGVRLVGCKMRLSLAPLQSGDLVEMVKLLNQRNGYADLVEELEINAACPNHRSDDGKLHDVLAHDPVALEALMAEAAEYVGKKAIKIAPQMSQESLIKCIELCLKYKFQTIVSGNTLLSNSTIDGKKRLSVDKGGVAGTPLFKPALQQVEDLCFHRNYLGILDNDLRIVGCGGIMTGDDVRAYLEAGACSVQVATLYHELGFKGVRDLVTELV